MRKAMRWGMRKLLLMRSMLFLQHSHAFADPASRRRAKSSASCPAGRNGSMQQLR
jgi:hypothetical protein